MQNALLQTIPPATLNETAVHGDRWLIRTIEKLKWQHRAEKYKSREDRGGISYIEKTVRKGDTIFDIGAHKGGYLYFFLKKTGTEGRIHAFEPQSSLHDYLLKLQHIFSLSNLILEQSAVSDKNGTALLCIPYNGRRGSSPCATIIDNPPYPVYRSKQEVCTVSLDGYCDKKQVRPYFIKVDVEGNELKVFRGAEKLLRNARPKLLFECEKRFAGEENMKETFLFLGNCGYTGHFIMDDSIFPIAKFDPRMHQDMQRKPYCNNFIFE